MALRIDANYESLSGASPWFTLAGSDGNLWSASAVPVVSAIDARKFPWVLAIIWKTAALVEILATQRKMTIGQSMQA